MNRALERWFAQFPEEVVIQARDVQRRAIAEEERRLNETAAIIASTLDNRSVTDRELDSIAEAGNLSRIEVLSADNQIIASGGAEKSLERHAELEAILAKIHSGESLDATFADGKGFDAASLQIPADESSWSFPAHEWIQA
jgi:nitrogen fixation/metabolism regulation signal transduction histidine kinase